MKIIFITFFILFFVYLFYKPTPSKLPKYIPTTNIDMLDVDEILLLALLNEYRIENGLEILQPDKIFNQVALDRNIYNSNRGFISHEGFVDSIQPLVIIGLTAGENLGYKYTSPYSVYSAWIKSDEHRKNILKSDWLYTGISIYIDDNGVYYYCQIFSR
jgi:uncharacterized protein YkwD